MAVSNGTAYANGFAYALTVGGHNVTRYIDDSREGISWSEIGAEGTAQMQFTVYGQNGLLPWAQVTSDNWNFANHAPEVYFRDKANARYLFGGNLVNVRRVHRPGPDVAAICTAISFDAWLSRRAALRWRTVENIGGVVRKISNDQDIIQHLIHRFAGMLNASNATVSSTNTNMHILELDGMSVDEQLGAVAEAAATIADPTTRRYFVDSIKRVHYFKGNESLNAPYRVGDDDYVMTLKNIGSLVSLWTLGESGGGTAYDAEGYANGTLNGGVNQTTFPLLANEPMYGSEVFDGSTGYVSASGANLHPGDTFSFECWFKRDSAHFGTAEALISAGVGDYEVAFNTSNQIRLTKVGTGDDFVTTGTVADQALHHLLVAHNAAGTVVYLDGASMAGTATLKVFVAAAGAINLGRRTDSTQYFKGRMSHAAVFNGKLTADNALNHYNFGYTIVPDYIEFEDELNTARQAVYVRGKTAAGSGWVYAAANRYDATEIIDRPHLQTAGAKDAVGTAWLRRDGAPIHGGKVTVSGFDGWRAGQSLYVHDAGLGIDNSYEIRSIEANPNMGSGYITYDIAFGALPWRGHFDLQRKPRRRQWALR